MVDGAAGSGEGLSHQIEIVARTVFGEARGEPWAGKLAVAWVIRNRANARAADGRPVWWGANPAAVCLKRAQFSCWNEDDPNLSIIKGATLDQFHFAECFGIAALVLTGDMLPDPTHGATHYYAVGIPEPTWAAAMSELEMIGAHRFFR